MARQTKRLGARFVATVAKPGMYADGDGLYLLVESATAKRWAFVFQWHGRRKEMGLGPVSSRSLADAREAVVEARRQVAQGVNPIEARASLRAESKAGEITFGQFAEQFVDGLVSEFRNPKHIDQWRMTLSIQRDDEGRLLDTGYCLSLRDKRIPAIGTEDVLRVLRPIWLTKPETASRVRGRIERVLDAAKVASHRTGENPARWRGHLNAILPKRQKLTRGHHAAMPYKGVPAFMSRLATVQGMGAKALRFLILQVKRTSEVVFARWPEIDLEAKLWVIPPERMKGGREHREPLTKEAVEVLRDLYLSRTDEWVFPGFMKDRPISTATMTKALRLAGGEDFTVHGFRSSFRDWAGEETSFPREIAEAALAHVVGDETERAYRRGDALAKRRKLMEAWERYCLAPPKSNVVPFIGGAAR